MRFERGLSDIPPQPSRQPRPVERTLHREMPGPLAMAATYAKIKIAQPALEEEAALKETARALGLPISTLPTIRKAVEKNRRTAFGSFSSQRRLGYPYEKDDESE